MAANIAKNLMAAKEPQNMAVTRAPWTLLNCVETTTMAYIKCKLGTPFPCLPRYLQPTVD